MSKSISQLDTEAVAHTTDLFEVAVVDAQSATGYASGKMSAEVIAEGMLNNFTYPTAMPNMQNKTITGAINQMLANFAPVYDSTATYSKDDVVTYNGQLYKANQDISVAEAWDSTHWTAIVVKQISGANQHNFSTTEQVVGTWIDGKPLYQKVIIWSGTLLLSDSAWTTIPFDDMPQDTMDFAWASMAYTGPLFDNRVRYQYFSNDHLIKAATSQSGGQNISTVILILNYTKTTS